MEKQYFTCPKNLIFRETGIDDWSIPISPAIGTVGCFSADRAPNWDLFIIVGFDEVTHMITAIFPRVRLNKETNEIQIGQDRLNENYQTDIKCNCKTPCQGDDFFCHCGADRRLQEEYKKTFIEASEDTQYEAHSFIHEHFRKFDWTYHEHITKRYLEDDTDFELPCYCKEH